MGINSFCNLGFQAFQPIKNKQTQPSSGPISPILVIAILSIVATVILLVSYYIFVNKCCSNWRLFSLLRFLPTMQNQQDDQDSFIALSPTMWNRGLDESIIREIPICQFKGLENTDQELRNNVFNCVVCLNDFRDEDMLRVLPNCSHGFHLDCIDIWLQKNANCPLCRTSISGSQANYPFNQIVAPSSSPQGSQAFAESLMGSDEDFVVIELGDDQNGTIQERQQERIIADSRHEAFTGSKMEGKLGKSDRRKRHHHVSMMGDECIDVRDKNEEFSIQPIRRSFSMDSATDKQLYLTVREIIQQNSHEQSEARNGEECSNRFRRSLFSFGLGRGSRNAVIPVEC